jgi:hypothetical protein
VVVTASCAPSKPPLIWSQALEVSPGTREALRTSKRLELTPLHAASCVGSPYPVAQIGATVFTADGQSRSTPRVFDAQGANALIPGTLEAAAINVSVSFGQLAPDLVFIPPADVLPEMGRALVVEGWVPGRPDLRARVTVPPCYECRQQIFLGGRAGLSGWTDGRGTDGGPGANVRVAIGYVDAPGDQRLVLVRIEDGGSIRMRTLLAPGAPPLLLVLDGGYGGPGGPGPVVSGAGPGHDYRPMAPGGNGGDGGAAQIFFDGAFPELGAKVVISNRGGAGGYSPTWLGRDGRPGPPPWVASAPGRELFRDELARGIPVTIDKASDAQAAQPSRFLRVP